MTDSCRYTKLGLQMEQLSCHLCSRALLWPGWGYIWNHTLGFFPFLVLFPPLPGFSWRLFLNKSLVPKCSPQGLLLGSPTRNTVRLYCGCWSWPWVVAIWYTPTECVWDSKPLRYPCWEPWPCVQKGRGWRTRRGPAYGLPPCRPWPWSNHEHHTNSHMTSPLTVYFLAVYSGSSPSIFWSPAWRLVQKAETAPLLAIFMIPPALLYKIFQNKDWNRNLAEFCNTEVYSRSTFIESGGWGRVMSPGGTGGDVHAKGSHTSGQARWEWVSPGGSRIIRSYWLIDGESLRKI